MLARWFLSRTVRKACDLRRHVRRAVSAQRDLLSGQALEAITAATEALGSALSRSTHRQELQERMEDLQKAASKWLKPYRHQAIRENVEVILVALGVALGIRTFFLQPFKIPTGSMQPTLYGITAEDLRNRPDAVIPPLPIRLFDRCFKGISYYRIVAETSGKLEAFEAPRMVLPFLYKQRFKIGATWYSVWSGWDRFLERTGVDPTRTYQQGEDIVKARVLSGDHLFVDRVTYNFRWPRRGEILVFETRGINNPLTGLPAMAQDQFYIKRMVAMGSERIQIGDDRHAVINGRRLDHTDPHFESVYSFDPTQPPRPSTYAGHLNGETARKYTDAPLAPLLPNALATYTLRQNHYLVLGDNTLDSYDGRAWGDFSRTNVIGKYCFVYWPITLRFGWAQQ